MLQPLCEMMGNTVLSRFASQSSRYVGIHSHNLLLNYSDLQKFTSGRDIPKWQLRMGTVLRSFDRRPTVSLQADPRLQPIPLAFQLSLGLVSLIWSGIVSPVLLGTS